MSRLDSRARSPVTHPPPSAPRPLTRATPPFDPQYEVRFGVRQPAATVYGTACLSYDPWTSEPDDKAWRFANALCANITNGARPFGVWYSEWESRAMQR